MSVIVSGAQILAHVRKTSPEADDTDWADTCAAAVTAVITRRVGDTTLSLGDEAEIERAALQAGAAAFVERDAPHGVLTFGPDGEAVRLSAALGRSLEPTFQQILGPGIG